MSTIRFSTQIKEEDLYKFNLHQAYRSTQGWFSIIVALLFLGTWVLKFSELNIQSKILCPVLALIVLCYLPFDLSRLAKNRMKQEVFQHPLNYEFTETGVVITSPTTDEPAELPWSYVYKISNWKDYLLIYSNRVNAYIIPMTDIEGQYSEIKEFIKNHVEDDKLQII